MIWLDMTQDALDAAYDQAVHAPNMDAVIARLASSSAAARERLGAPLRFSYGEGDAEGLDVYASGIKNSPLVVFIHGGTWRYGSAADNAFAAETFVAAGINFVVPDFSPVDDFQGNLEGMIDQLQRAIAWIYANANDFNGDVGQIYLAGFSSGAHLAGVLLTTDWVSHGLPKKLFRGALLCSGMYDMTPVSLSYRSEFVNLGPDNIPALSPQMNIEKIESPLIVATGSHESPEFQRQANTFVSLLRAEGRPVKLLTAEGCNHFEIIETLGSPDGVLGEALLDMVVSAEN